MMMLLRYMTTKPKGVILGLDPGIGRIGYAVITGSRSTPNILTLGCLETSRKLSQAERLGEIAAYVRTLLKQWRPDGVAVERLYFSTNVKTALAVAEARGVITLTIQESGCKLYEFSPQEVKLAATGQGNADKKQVQKMLKLMFKLPTPPKPDDAADALALALCAVTKVRI